MFDLDRFLKAQEPVFETALAELRAGQKQSHWMWFVFPQLRGLGRSPMAQHYGINSLGEAAAYLGHPVLGARLRQCVEAVLALQGKSLRQIFGVPDDIKFRSSMTLFALAAGEESVFQEALNRYNKGVMDQMTVELVRPPQTSA
ncbi:MAG: DUF1810 domain-containing protein [Aestuariivirga sp.]|nr:DUF1810 domain-containing protein [Aestuariivirga sp.]